VLFCGGPVWRKGLDVFLRAVLAAWQAGPRFCVVVKTVGGDQHYGRFHLGELLRALPAHAGHAAAARRRRRLSRAATGEPLHRLRRAGAPVPRRGLLPAGARGARCGLPVLATAAAPPTR
jgi:hypothetical protein